MVRRWRSTSCSSTREPAQQRPGSFGLRIASLRKRVLGAGAKGCSRVGESKVNFDGSLPDAD